MRYQGSQPDIERWYNNTARRFLKRPTVTLLTRSGRSRPTPQRYGSSQAEIDSIVTNELNGIRFSAKPTYNPRIRTEGKTTAAVISGIPGAKILKIEIGKQRRPGKEELIDTLIHEELEARIIIRAHSGRSRKFTEMFTQGDRSIHLYIDRVIARYIQSLRRKGVLP